MGNAVGYFKSHGKRILNYYNAQNRALEFIEREKLPRAPRHAISVEIPEDSSNLSDLGVENTRLHEHLKNIYVQSYTEPIDETALKSSKRPLLQVRDDDSRVFLPDPTDVEKGYCTLTQASAFLTAYEEDPVSNNESAIAKAYNLDVSKVEKIVEYYSIYNMYTTSKMKFSDGETAEKNGANSERLLTQDDNNKYQETKCELENRKEITGGENAGKENEFKEKKLSQRDC